MTGVGPESSSSVIKDPGTGHSRGMIRNQGVSASEPPIAPMPTVRLTRTDDDPRADDISHTGDIALLRLRAAVHARVLNTTQRPVAIGRYTVLDLLGVGGMGVVYAAYDGELGRKVAVKLLATADEPSPEHRARLLREAQAMARLSHPNVVQIYDVGTREQQVFIAMELIEGQTLTRWLATTHTWQEVLEKFLAAGRGLSAAHRAGLVHRDFKPDNVLVDVDGRARVADFGLVGAAGDATSGVPRLTPPMLDASAVTPLTVEGAILGTPLYMSPEQHLGRGVDERSDQYSFCVALYRALYGQYPFPTDDVKTLREAVLRGQPCAPPANSRAPQRLFAALRRGLSSDAEKRFPNMDALLQVLESQRSPRLGRWTRGALALAASLAIVVGYGGMSRLSSAETCDAKRELDGVWDDARREATRSRMLAVAPEVGASISQEIAGTFDAYARRWSAAWEQRCAPDGETDAASERLALARRLCLETRRMEFAATVELLQEADETMARNAPQVLATLPDLDTCTDDQTALFQVASAMDLDAVNGSATQQIRRSLTRSRAYWYAGDPERALALADQARIDALARNAPALAAEAGVLWVQIGQLGPGHSRPDDLVSRLQAARELAEGSGYHAVAVRAEVLAAFLDHETSFSATREALLRVQAKVTATRDPEATWLFHFFLATPMLTSDPAERREHEEAAAAISDARFGPGHAYAQWTKKMQTLYRSGAALDALRSNLDELRRMYGPTNPPVAEALQHLAFALLRAGQHKDALLAYQDVIRLWTEIRGADALEVGEAWHRLGHGLRVAGDLNAALAAFQRAAEIFRANPPVDPHGLEQPLSTTLEALAGVLRDLGRAEEALEPIQRAHQACVALKGEDPWCDNYGVQEAEILLRLGRPALALERLAVADPDPAQASSPTSWIRRMGWREIVLGETLIALDRHSEAIAPLEQALGQIGEPMAARLHRPGHSARVQFALARACVATDAARAVELATAARATLRGLSEKERAAVQVSLVDVDAWLAAAVPAPAHPHSSDSP